MCVGISKDVSGFVRDILKMTGNWILVPALLMDRKNEHLNIRILDVILVITLLLQCHQLLYRGYWSGLSDLPVEYYRPCGPFSNPNVTAYLGVVVFLLRQKQTVLMTLMIVFIILLTQSRSAILIFLILYISRLGIRGKINVAVLFFLCFGFLYDALLNSRFGLLLGTNSSEYIQNSRLFPWTYTFLTWLQRPFFGFGYGSMDRIVPIGGGLGPHNFFLFVLGTSGLAGFFALILGLRDHLKYTFVRFREYLLVIIGLILMLNHDMLLLGIYPLIIGLLDERNRSFR